MLKVVDKPVVAPPIPLRTEANKKFMTEVTRVIAVAMDKGSATTESSHVAWELSRQPGFELGSYVFGSKRHVVKYDTTLSEVATES